MQERQMHASPQNLSNLHNSNQAIVQLQGNRTVEQLQSNGGNLMNMSQNQAQLQNHQRWISNIVPNHSFQNEANQSDLRNENRQEMLEFRPMFDSNYHNTYSIEQGKYNSSSGHNENTSKFMNHQNQKLFKIDDIVLYEREEIIPIFRRPKTKANQVPITSIADNDKNYEWKNKTTKDDHVSKIDQKALKYIKNFSKLSQNIKVAKPLVGLKRPLQSSKQMDSDTPKQQKIERNRGQLLISINLDNEPEPPQQKQESVEVKLVTLLQKYKSDLITQTENSQQSLQTLQKIEIISQLIKIQSMSNLKDQFQQKLSNLQNDHCMSPRTKANQMETDRQSLEKIKNLKKLEVEKFLICTSKSIQNFEDMIDFEQLKQIVKGDGENEADYPVAPLQQVPAPEIKPISTLAPPVQNEQNYQQQHLNYLSYLDKIQEIDKMQQLKNEEPKHIQAPAISVPPSTGAAPTPLPKLGSTQDNQNGKFISNIRKLIEEQDVQLQKLQNKNINESNEANILINQLYDVQNQQKLQKDLLLQKIQSIQNIYENKGEQMKPQQQQQPQQQPLQQQAQQVFQNPVQQAPQQQQFDLAQQSQGGQGQVQQPQGQGQTQDFGQYQQAAQQQQQQPLILDQLDPNMLQYHYVEGPIIETNACFQQFQTVQNLPQQQPQLADDQQFVYVYQNESDMQFQPQQPYPQTEQYGMPYYFEQNQTQYVPQEQVEQPYIVYNQYQNQYQGQDGQIYGQQEQIKQQPDYQYLQNQVNNL